MKKRLLTFLILILIILPTLLPFFNSRFFYTQDYIFIARLNQMSTALQDRHFPVRWAADLRYGEPIFNFYSPLPYYLGGIIGLLGIDFLWTSKILFILSSVLSALTMYILAKKLFGQKAGFLAATLYTYAPYRAVDLYVRGALSETWAFIFFPLIFYTSYLLSERVNLKRIAFLALSLAGLFLTHNVTTLMFLPFLILWWGYLILKQKNLKLIVIFLVSFILGFGISSFFLLPAFFERPFIQTKYLIVGYFNFRAHFVAFKQFFSLFWGYGSSLWGPQDGLSFQVGLANWVVLIIAGILGIIFRKDKKLLFLLSFLGISFILSIFLQHNKSAFIWEIVPNMAFIQFPWRFLSISIFICALTGAAIIPYLKNNFGKIYFVLIILSIVASIQYFKPKEYTDNSFFDKFLNKEIMRKGVDLTKDYLPIWVAKTDEDYLKVPESKMGKIAVISFDKKTAFATSMIKVLEDAEIVVPVTFFPNWEVYSNGKILEQETPSEKGLIRFKLPKGDYHLQFEFKDTPVRIMGNAISALSLLALILILAVNKFSKHE